MDSDFVKATLSSLQPHLDALKTHVDTAGAAADPQHVLNHLNAVQTNVGLVQAHASQDVPKEGIVQKAVDDVKAAFVGTSPVAAPAAAPVAAAPVAAAVKPSTVTPAAAASTGWISAHMKGVLIGVAVSAVAAFAVWHGVPIHA